MPGPHDALFRATFAKPENAAAELRRVLPQELVAKLDFSSLQALPGRFIEDDLEDRESDLLLAAHIDGAETLIYVLVEHQSSVRWDMPLRLLRYMTGAWGRYVHEHPTARRLPPIVPVVLHHSPTGWTAATSLADLLEVPDALRPAIARHLPDFRFILHDLAREDLDALRDAPVPAQLKFVLFLMQRTRDNPALEHELALWVDVARQLADDALRLVMSYILTVADADPGPIGDWAHQVGQKAEDAYVTAAEKIAQRERAKALVEGRIEGRVEGRREVLRKQLTRRFGPLPQSALLHIRDATEEQLDDWALRVLDAPTIEQVFLP